jgi:predicted nuclease of predicted toxin-antitoxin system
MPGIADHAILRRPDIGALVLLTFDRDFGELIFRHGFPPPLAILYSRIGRTDPGDAADRIRLLIEKGLPERHMIRIARDGERLKPFPDGADNG